MHQGALAQPQQELTQAQHTQQELRQQRHAAQTETQQWQERHTGRRAVSGRDVRAGAASRRRMRGTPATTAQPDSTKYAGKHHITPALRAGTATADHVASTADGTG